MPEHRAEEEPCWNPAVYFLTREVRDGLERAGYHASTIKLLDHIIRHDKPDPSHNPQGWRKGYCWPKVETLAESCRLSEPSVNRHLHQLVAGGLIVRLGDGGRSKTAKTYLVWGAIMAAADAEWQAPRKVRSEALNPITETPADAPTEPAVIGETLSRVIAFGAINPITRDRRTELREDSELREGEATRESRAAPSAACDVDTPQPPAEVVPHLVAPVSAQARTRPHAADEWYDAVVHGLAGEQRFVAMYARNIAAERCRWEQVPERYLVAVLDTMRSQPWGVEALGAVSLEAVRARREG